nr:hypothetical protein [Tanacetum cinerariifolium]
MADHSQKWHDGVSNRRMGSNSSDGITVITNKHDNLGRDMRKLMESVHAIQVKDKQEKDKIGSKPDKNGKRGEAGKSQKQLQRVVPTNYNPKGERFLIASRFPTPPLACAFFSPGATVTCAKCGHPVNGPYCQGCTLLREKLEEDLVTYSKYFQDTSESSDDSTNVVNAPREPVVVKQDHGVNPPQINKCCCECGNALDGIYCQQCISWDRVFEIKHALGTKQYKPEDIQELFRQLLNDVQNHEELAEYVNTPGWNRPAFYDDDDDVDYTIAIAPVLSTEEPVDFLIEEIKDDNLREKLLNVHLLIANIEALKDNPTPSSKLLTKSSTTSPKYFLEETNTFHNSLPKFENFYFDLEEISSGSTTTHSDISLSDYDSFTFDLSNDQCTPTDRSDFANEEFADELAHIISPPEYLTADYPDCGVSRFVIHKSFTSSASFWES